MSLAPRPAAGLELLHALPLELLPDDDLHGSAGSRLADAECGAIGRRGGEPALALGCGSFVGLLGQRQRCQVGRSAAGCRAHGMGPRVPGGDVGGLGVLGSRGGVQPLTESG